MYRKTLKLLKVKRLSLEDSFDHPYLLITIFSIGIAFIIYVINNYYTNSTISKMKLGYTFFGKNPIKDIAVFTNTTVDSTACMTLCNQNPKCQGITYDTTNSSCVGTANGQLLSDDSNYSAWIKPTSVATKDAFLSKTLITAFTNTPLSVNQITIPQPSLVGQFTFSFWINITDWYANFKYWKHVAHKGTAISAPINYQEWSDIIATYPDQCIGLWLAPFTNNLRIAITTAQPITTSPIQQEDETEMSTVIFNTSSIEYFDIPNIPINTLYNITTCFNENLMEIYTNGNLLNSIQLKGIPVFNKSNMFIMYDKTFIGGIYNLLYVPSRIKYSNITSIYSSKPVITS
jgi:hypothetical protein